MITTGKIGETIAITGDNLYAISSVVFANDASGSFTEFNDSLLVTIPKDAAWGRVSISSEQRQVVGDSSFLFVPEPIITGFYPISGSPNDIITINGYSLSGITGVYFNNLPSLGVSVTSPYSLSATLPTGNTNGYIKVVGASGLYHVTDTLFYPLAQITGLSSYSLRTGEAFTISGANFLPNILLSDSSINNNYFVSFNGATGSFGLVSSLKMTGIIPPGATSGPVTLLKTIVDSHPSNYSLTVFPSAPVLSSVNISSGNIGDSIYLNGTNFNTVTKIRFYRTGVFTDVVSGFYSSSLENLISVIIPTGLTEGRQDIIITASGGQVTGSGYVLVRKPASISGISPSYALAGQILRISGNNLYSDSKVYFNDLETPALDLVTGHDENIFLDLKMPGQSSLENSIIIDNNNSIYYYPNIIQFIQSPRISGFYPLSGGWGDAINISGTGFTYVNSLTLNTLSGQFSIINDTGINFIIPTGAHDSYLTISNILSDGVSLTALNVIDPSGVISGFSPSLIYTTQDLIISGLYLDRITGVVFSGASGLFTTSDFGLQSGTNNIIVTVPEGALTQRVLLQNESARSESSSILTILQPPVITGLDPQYARYQDTIRISGYNFSGTQFYFRDFRGGYVSGENTTIISSTLATTRVSRFGRGGLVTNNMCASGFNGMYESSIKFYPLPTINSIDPFTTGTQIGDRLVIELINGSEVTGFLISGSGRISNIIDSRNDLLFNYDIEYPHTVVTGYINGSFYGTGWIYPIWSGWQGFENNISAPFSGSKYGTSIINLTGGNITLSGIGQDKVSYNQILHISGSNLKRVKELHISGSLAGAISFPFAHVNDKLITGSIGLLPDQPISPAKIILKDYSNNFTTYENNVTYYQDMRFTHSSKPLQGSTIYTGTYLVVSGSHFQGLPAFGYGAAYLRNASITDNSIPVYIDSYYSNFLFGDSLDQENIAIITPDDNTLTDQTYDLYFINDAGGTGILSGIKLSNYQSVRNLDELEMKIYLFG